jgi:sulfur relay (sulfurtransferase) DsrF/TusC family protein
MTPRVLFIITSDPRASPRAAEAIRIAAGVAAWRNVEVGLYLHGAAVLSLSECAEGQVDEDNFALYLPLLGAPGQPVYVQQGAPQLATLGTPALDFQPITNAELARLAATCASVLRF